MKSLGVKFLSAAIITAFGLISSAHSAVLTFESIPGGTGVNSSTSTEAGYDLLVSLLFLDGSGNGAGGSATELEGLCCSSGGSLTVTKTGGGSFTFTSLDVELEYRSPATVTLMGYLSGILQGTDHLLASGGYTTGFASNLASLNIDTLVVTGQRDFAGGASFDNLVLSAAGSVPIPGTLALVAPLIAGLAMIRRRRQS